MKESQLQVGAIYTDGTVNFKYIECFEDIHVFEILDVPCGCPPFYCHMDLEGISKLTLK